MSLSAGDESATSGVLFSSTQNTAGSELESSMTVHGNIICVNYHKYNDEEIFSEHSGDPVVTQNNQHWFLLCI